MRQPKMFWFKIPNFILKYLSCIFDTSIVAHVMVIANPPWLLSCRCAVMVMICFNLNETSCKNVYNGALTGVCPISTN